jgi:hypothetical protein
MPVKSLNAHGLTYISSFIFVTADKHILQLYLYPVIQVLAVKNRERKMSHECSPSPPLPRCLSADNANPSAFSPPAQPSSSLNPYATPFSPSLASRRASGEELSEWLLFSPSFSEGRSPPSSCLPCSTLSPSFTDIVKGKGKAPMDPSRSRADRSKGKAPALVASQMQTEEPSHCLSSQVGQVMGGFMADACCASSSHRR